MRPRDRDQPARQQLALWAPELHPRGPALLGCRSDDERLGGHHQGQSHPARRDQYHRDQPPDSRSREGGDPRLQISGDRRGLGPDQYRQARVLSHGRDAGDRRPVRSGTGEVGDRARPDRRGDHRQASRGLGRAQAGGRGRVPGDDRGSNGHLGRTDKRGRLDLRRSAARDYSLRRGRRSPA